MVYFCVASTKIYLYLWLSEKLVAKQLICGTAYYIYMYQFFKRNEISEQSINADVSVC